MLLLTSGISNAFLVSLLEQTMQIINVGFFHLKIGCFISGYIEWYKEKYNHYQVHSDGTPICIVLHL